MRCRQIGLLVFMQPNILLDESILHPVGLGVIGRLSKRLCMASTRVHIGNIP